MPFPDPKPGLVVRHAYLWEREDRLGRIEGRKDRPCVVLVTRETKTGPTEVWVAPITHSEPEDPYSAFELPMNTKRRLRLDGERSWVVLSEANGFNWPGPDLRMTEHGAFAYGELPGDVWRGLQDVFAAQIGNKAVLSVYRPE